jgi:hypothetical protein
MEDMKDGPYTIQITLSSRRVVLTIQLAVSVCERERKCEHISKICTFFFFFFFLITKIYTWSR